VFKGMMARIAPENARQDPCRSTERLRRYLARFSR
jgi:hypothetical protein